MGLQKKRDFGVDSTRECVAKEHLLECMSAKSVTWSGVQLHRGR